MIIWCSKLEQALHDGFFPKNESYCHGYRGCQYRELCSTCDDEVVKETLYEKHNPFEYLESSNKTDTINKIDTTNSINTNGNK